MTLDLDLFGYPVAPTEAKRGQSHPFSGRRPTQANGLLAVRVGASGSVRNNLNNERWWCVSHDRNATPVGRWRQVTEPMLTRAECRPWHDQIERNGASDVKIARCLDHAGRTRWAVFAKRRREEVGIQSRVTGISGVCANEPKAAAHATPKRRGPSRGLDKPVRPTRRAKGAAR